MNGDGPTQRVNGVLGADLLHKIQGHADGHDNQDDNETCGIAGGGRQAAGHQQDQHQRIAEAGQELCPKRRSRYRCRVVWPVLRKPLPRLIVVESAATRVQTIEQPGQRIAPDILGADSAGFRRAAGCGHWDHCSSVYSVLVHRSPRDTCCWARWSMRFAKTIAVRARSGISDFPTRQRGHLAALAGREDLKLILYRTYSLYIFGRPVAFGRTRPTATNPTKPCTTQQNRTVRGQKMRLLSGFERQI